MARFKKGRSGNPSGRPKLTPEEKAVKQLTRETWNDLAQKMMTCNERELQLLSEDPNLPYEAVLFLRHVLALGIEPDLHAYEKYLARRIGPVKQELELSAPQPIVIRRRGSVELGVRDGKEDE